MADLRFFVIPSMLLAASVGYVALNPSGAALEPLATATPTATERPTYTPIPTATPVAITLDVDGTLTWQTANDGLRAVEFPSGAPVAPSTPEAGDWSASDDGVWHYDTDCHDTGCAVKFWSTDGRTGALPGPYAIWDAKWQPGSHGFAFSVSEPNAAPADRIILVDDPALPVARVVYGAGLAGVAAFDWYMQDGVPLLLVARGGARPSVGFVGVNGWSGDVVDVPRVASYFHASPNGHTFAFTVSDPAGWRLMTIDADGVILAATDHGAMGSDGPDGLPVPDPPDNGKGPMYIAWSPDGSKLAFGGGFEPPYIMTTVDVLSNTVARTEFQSGYPGEIKWSPDGASIAVSTYDVDRTHHETWVVDPATGAGTHLMDGCVIVWSPDSRFLAVHGEDRPGIAIIDAATGARMQLTSDPADVPISWVG